MKRTSKYLNKQFGNWTCTHVGVAVKTAVFKGNTRIRNAYPHHQTYYYIFERETSDGKAEKLVRLNERQAAAVYRGETTVEAIAEVREARKVTEFKTKVSYHFIDRQ